MRSKAYRRTKVVTVKLLHGSAVVKNAELGGPLGHSALDYVAEISPSHTALAIQTSEKALSGLSKTSASSHRLAAQDIDRC